MEIKTNTLKALLLMAGKKDIRFQLNGILFESTTERCFAVTTNGHCLAVAMLGESDTTQHQSIIAREYMESAIKSAGSTISITFTETTATIGSVTVPLINARFPDWRRVLRNTAPTNERAYFNPDYLALANKVGQTYHKGCKTYLVQQSGNNLGHCAIADDFHAVVMPMRDSYFKPLPTWIELLLPA